MVVQSEQRPGRPAQNKVRVEPEPGTRQRILQAALEVLTERHSAKARLRHIAEKAGLHYGNLHYYFRSKNDLYLALLDSMLQPIISERRAMMANAAIPPGQKLDTLLQRNQELIERSVELRVILDFMVQFSEDGPVRQKLQLMYRNWRADIAEIIRQGIAVGEFRPNWEEMHMAPTILVSLIDGFTTQYFLDPDSGDPAAYITSIRSMLYRLLMPPK